ncbi:polyphosphate polymerase domain-containing protein [Anaerosphaera multitolerans]|uniref:Polyphosphate polymerase domain-containing protein n=1 Tax=Anaerosphaera multitolerans TaxID=2487351 RepID=A0A437SA77_9FIRM|nr:polyphosphate polymerase domain-containing protein [Anaerosphaera multitolerans]RVU55717.1 polyphosphate polymerase domain-containing protein [Anaerosphaera multitolerans]
MKGRHELKHNLNYLDYMVLRKKLISVLPRDKNTKGRREYKISSLYFDTPKDEALREKINGVNHREKFRIRYYNDDYNLIKLEKKSKINNLTYKESKKICKEEVEKIIKGDVSWMLESKDPILIEFYSKYNSKLLRPKTIVQYYREPFVFPAGNVRITFDRDIRRGMRVTDFFSGAPVSIPAGEEEIILEVKYDEFLPGFIRDIVQLGNRQSTACSKYANCRIYG